MELLADVLRNMTAVEEINLSSIYLSSSACDMLMEVLTANQAQNPDLKKIYLKETGDKDNKNFSEAAKAHIATLKAQGVEVKDKK